MNSGFLILFSTNRNIRLAEKNIKNLNGCFYFRYFLTAVEEFF